MKTAFEKYVTYLKKESFRTKDQKKPRKISKYNVFCAEERKKITGLSISDTMKELSKKWTVVKENEKKMKKLDEKSKNQYEEALIKFGKFEIDQDILDLNKLIIETIKKFKKSKKLREVDEIEEEIDDEDKEEIEDEDEEEIEDEDEEEIEDDDLIQVDVVKEKVFVTYKGDWQDEVLEEFSNYKSKFVNHNIVFSIKKNEQSKFVKELTEFKQLMYS
jgi:hypothetical protein